uniref:AlNc14C264G9857 protein n=1 Tax=Albugo laibachii Nc14 TaxID=890382 RepID=F0WU34_9STRA|nr:AlNc14C264G9857 [Albugo laibachii Nc14]|eukprot:CCA24879.1 AlNc14C264G9857 [Albugo laibachii Nc14]
MSTFYLSLKRSRSGKQCGSSGIAVRSRPKMLRIAITQCAQPIEYLPPGNRTKEYSFGYGRMTGINKMSELIHKYDAIDMEGMRMDAFIRVGYQIWEWELR